VSLDQRARRPFSGPARIASARSDRRAVSDMPLRRPAMNLGSARALCLGVAKEKHLTLRPTALTAALALLVVACSPKTQDHAAAAADQAGAAAASAANDTVVNANRAADDGAAAANVAAENAQAAAEKAARKADAAADAAARTQ
jgi:hypothetical protein